MKGTSKDTTSSGDSDTVLIERRIRGGAKRVWALEGWPASNLLAPTSYDNRDYSCQGEVMERGIGAAVLLAFFTLGACDGLTTGAEQPQIFEAVMVGENVAPDPVDTDASAVATAQLSGNTLVVSGSFTELSSALRDIDEDPMDPGIHIHPGAEGETESYIFGLTAALNEDERSGIFSGTFTLTDDQVDELRAGRMYMDIHTEEYPDGEVRDQLRQGGTTTQ